MSKVDPTKQPVTHEDSGDETDPVEEELSERKQDEILEGEVAEEKNVATMAVDTPASSLLGHFKTVLTVAARGTDDYLHEQGHLDAGLDPKMTEVDMTLSAPEQFTVLTALHIVGFFAPSMIEASREITKRLVEVVNAKQNGYTEEEKQQIQSACDRAYEQLVADAYGVTVEELRKDEEEMEVEGFDDALQPGVDGPPLH